MARRRAVERRRAGEHEATRAGPRRELCKSSGGVHVHSLELGVADASDMRGVQRGDMHDGVDSLKHDLQQRGVRDVADDGDRRRRHAVEAEHVVVATQPRDDRAADAARRAGDEDSQG